MTSRLFFALGVLLAATPATAQDDIFARRDQWQKIPEMIAALGPVAGKTIVDMAAGDGYLTKHLARAVGRAGQVIAVEIGDSAIARLGRLAATDSFGNVRVVRGTDTDPRLPGVVDGVVILNAYHELPNYKASLAAILHALRPGGRLVLVDNSGFGDWNARPRDWQVSHHAIDPAIVEAEVRAAGFSTVRRADHFISMPIDQWLIIASKPLAGPGGGDHQLGNVSSTTCIDSGRSPAISPETTKR